MPHFVNTLPNNIIADHTTLKGFADHNVTLTQNLIFSLRMIENIVEKGEYAGYQQFILFQQCFRNFLS